ncbi:MAG: hypothetical protein WBY53_02005 [Acidobacteriaceae bacterium]
MSSINWKTLGEKKQAEATAANERHQSIQQEQRQRFEREHSATIANVKRAQSSLLVLLAECTKITNEFNEGVADLNLQLKISSQQWSNTGELISFEVWRENGIYISHYSVSMPGEVTINTYPIARQFSGKKEKYRAENEGELYSAANNAPLSFSHIAAENTQYLVNLN